MAKKAQRTRFSEGGGRAFPGISGHFLWFIWSSYGLKNILGGVVKKNSDRTHLSPHPNSSQHLLLGLVFDRLSSGQTNENIDCHNLERSCNTSMSTCHLRCQFLLSLISQLVSWLKWVRCQQSTNNNKLKHALVGRFLSTRARMPEATDR